MSTRTTLSLSAIALASLVQTAAMAAQAQDSKTVPATAQKTTERCYGISLAGHNDCASSAAGSSCAGAAPKDYDGQAWKRVPVGTCETTVTPKGGHGSLKPFKS